MSEEIFPGHLLDRFRDERIEEAMKFERLEFEKELESWEV